MQHRQAFVDQFLHHALGQVCPGLELVDDDAFDLEFGVVVGLDFLHVFQQGVQGTARKIVAIKRDQTALRSNQRAAGVEVQRRGRIDVNLVVVFCQQLQRIAQFVDLVARLQLAVQLVEQRAGRHHVQAFPLRVDNELLCTLVPNREFQALLKELGHIRQTFGHFGTQQVTRGIALGVQVDDQSAQSLPGTDGSQVAGNGGLAYATFLVEHDMLHGWSPG